MLMRKLLVADGHSDLFPSSNRNKTKNGNVAEVLGEYEDILNVLEKEMP